MIFFFWFCFHSDPPLSEEDIPSGLWMCHMCQMLQKQRTSNTSKILSNDEDSMHNDIQKLKDSRPSTPIASDGVINAAKVRLNQKRSLSRISSSSENSLSSDRELKVKLTRIDMDQCSSNSNGAEMIERTENNTLTINENDIRNGNEREKPIENAPMEINLPLSANSEFKKPCEEIRENDETKRIDDKSAESMDQYPIDETEKSQQEIRSAEMKTNDEIIELSNDSDENGVEKCDETSEEKTEDSKSDFKSPFDVLIRAASILNPRQFELPRELTIYPQFPGDEKGKLFIIFFLLQFKSLIFFRFFLFKLIWKQN